MFRCAFLDFYISADIWEYLFFKSPNICISIGLKKFSFYRSGSNINTQKRDKASQFQVVELYLMELESELCRD